VADASVQPRHRAQAARAARSAVAVGALYAAGLLLGCGDNGLPKGRDGGSDGGESDASTKDAGRSKRDAGSMGGGKFGAACKKTADCGRALFCDTEIDTSFAAQNLPAGAKQVMTSAFPGGVCTPVPAAAYDPNGVRSCDPLLPQAAQGCGANGSCVGIQTTGQNTVVACRTTCDPGSAQGCGRPGYTCDFELKACVEGCQSDAECRLQLLDSNADGRADALAYDTSSKAVCDMKTSRCVLNGGGASQATGDACERLDDCEADGLCFRALQNYAGLPFPGGYCSKLGCDLKGRECSGSGAICTDVRPWDGSSGSGKACFQSCPFGAEPEADRVGVNGHGQGCRAGYRCHYNANPGTDTGVCAGGNYNAVAKNNVGQTCKTDADCYSPFGLGSCIALSVGGVAAPGSICTIMDCSVPGLPSDLCGGGNQCIGLNGDVTFCAQSCIEASECGTAYACADDDADPSTSKICFPVCLMDSDCRKGTERCNVDPMTMLGSCVASRQ
jgi:hypothetical protein